MSDQSVDAPIYDEDARVSYMPWTNGYAVGFKCKDAQDRVTYIYLNPSGGSDDGVATVFVYEGSQGDPLEDAPSHHYNIEWG